MNPLPDIRQLRIFIALEDTRSFTGAANSLNITQSAVSHSIKSLEVLLSCQLIERLGKKCILTPHGEVFLHHAKNAVLQLESALKKIDTLNTWGYTALKIGASNTLCQYIIPKTLASFYKDESRCEIFITPNDTTNLIGILSKGKLDIAFGIRKPSLEAEHPFTSLFKDELCFVTSPDHRWCKKSPTTSEDYASERFIIYGDDSITSEILKPHLSGIGIRQKTTLSMANMESIKEMTSLNIGVGIVSDWTAKDEFKNGTLVKHPIYPSPVREWGYYLARSKVLSLKEERFIKEFTKQLRETITNE